MMGYRVGVDIGGTFTDIAIVTSDGRRFSKKVPSTPDDFARAIIDGLMQSVDDGMVDLAGITELIHGTTVASNAILELKGARTGLITTAGFRDILEIRNLRMPRLYDLTWTKPPALVERYLRMEVRERVNAKGEIEIPIDEADIERAVQRLLDEEVEAIAVCLLHSYANPDHERVIKRVVERMAPGLTLCISSEVLPEIKEYERTSTTVINAYVRPIVRHYLASLTSELRRIGVARPLLLMQSNGGLTSAESASAMPMNIIESGPAAGVIGVHALAQEIGLDKVISFDMGGTTAKASIIERGIVSRASEYSVGGGIMLGSRLLTGAGYTLKVPAIDLAEVGAGGGSILWIDVGGALQIGPHSAGATPGPVCYDAGGTEPTVTDANIVLGYLNPDHLVGGSLKLKAEKSVAALRERIAEPLGLSVEDAAHGAHLIAASNMIRAIKAVSSERGRDPREFALVGFGGNGPLFAAGMAQTLGIGQVIIPHHAGVFSSFGLLASDVEHHGSRSIRAPLRAIDPAVLGTMFAEMQAEGLARVADDGVAASRAEVTRTLGLRYLGQSFDLPVAVPPGPITADTLLALEQAYGAEHEQTYGHRGAAGETVEMVVARLVVRGIDPDRHVRHAGQPAATGKPPSSRRAYFGRDHGWLDTPVLDRAALALPRVGPCIIEEYDSTCVVPPGCHAALSDAGNIVITIAR